MNKNNEHIFANKRYALLLIVAVTMLLVASLKSTGTVAASSTTEPQSGGISYDSDYAPVPEESGGITYDKNQKPKKKKKTNTKKRKAQQNRKRKKKSSAHRRKKTKRSSKKKKTNHNSKKGDGAFPIRGTYNFGSSEAQFGADRGDHTHQGQDIMAAEGTAVVAPTDGIVTWKSYQEDGAGYYLVIQDSEHNRSYVFMHLKKGTLLVSVGDTVKSGQKIAEVGQTGRAEGPHLHFEVWIGGWQTDGGKPVDPLPLLHKWE